MQGMKCKSDGCKGVLMWQNDFDFEDCGYKGEGVVGLYICSECELLHELLTTDRIVSLQICEYGDDDIC